MTRTASFSFRHLDTGKSKIRLGNDAMRFAERGSAEHALLATVVGLADAAIAFFDGIYPSESPYFFWGEGIALPWMSADEPSPDRARDEAITHFIRELEVVRTRNQGEEGVLTYFSEPLSATSQKKIQSLAVEALIALEEYVEWLLSGDTQKAVPFLSAAYEAVIEATCQAWDVFGNARLRAQAGGRGRHRNDPRQKEKAFIYQCYLEWRANPRRYKSKAAFARDMLDKCEALTSQKKIEDWVRQWDREREKRNPAG